MKRIFSLLLTLTLAAPAWAVGEIQLDDPSLTGQTLYVVIKNASGNALTTGTTFAAYTTTRADFDQTMGADISGTGLFTFNFPAVTAGNYTWKIYQDANDDATPSHVDDISLADGGGYWMADASMFGSPSDVLLFGGTAGTFTAGRPSIQDAEGDLYGEVQNGVRGLVDRVVLTDTATTLTEEISGNGTPGQVHNQEPVKARTSKLGTRRDAVCAAFPEQRVVPGQITQVWVDCSAQVGSNIENVTNGASTSAEVALSGVGMYGKHASLLIDATDAEDGDTATVTCNVTPFGVQVLPISLAIVVDDD